MLAPLKWLLSYTDLKINTKEEIHELASEMTLTGTKVEEVVSKGEEIDRVVVAKCLEVRRHENSDHLFVCKLDIGADEPIQIITGAQNMRAGAYVPAALDGSTIAGGRVIKAGKLRGLESNGMMCSFEEIGLDCKDYEGGSNDRNHDFTGSRRISRLQRGRFREADRNGYYPCAWRRRDGH